MSANTILDDCSTYVRELLLEKLPTGRLYHNYAHAAEVAEVCETLARDAGLKGREREMLVLTAWFHDCGYAIQPDNVVEGGVRTARKFLEKHNYPPEGIETVAGLIRSVHADEEPVDDLQKILRDANMSYLGRKRFFRRSRLLKLEMERMEGKKYTSKEWNVRLLESLMEHRFYTPWAEEEFSDRRVKNILAQRGNISQAEKTMLRKKTGKDFGRGVDTLYRITLRNHINLSRIADGKANMIISVNTLVLSILITAGAAVVSLDQLSLKGNLIVAIPVLILMLTALTAIVFAVFSAIPKVSGEDFEEEDVKEHKVSLLFFSNFLKLEKPVFVGHLRELKRDQELLYDDLARDLYNLGAVLKKKYRLLTIAYRVFVGGLVLSLVAFLILIMI